MNSQRVVQSSLEAVMQDLFRGSVRSKMARPGMSVSIAAPDGRSFEAAWQGDVVTASCGSSEYTDALITLRQENGHVMVENGIVGDDHDADPEAALATLRTALLDLTSWGG